MCPYSCWAKTSTNFLETKHIFKQISFLKIFFFPFRFTSNIFGVVNNSEFFFFFDENVFFLEGNYEVCVMLVIL